MFKVVLTHSKKEKGYVSITFLMTNTFFPSFLIIKRRSDLVNKRRSDLLKYKIIYKVRYNIG